MILFRHFKGVGASAVAVLVCGGTTVAAQELTSIDEARSTKAISVSSSIESDVREDSIEWDDLVPLVVDMAQTNEEVSPPQPAAPVESRETIPASSVEYFNPSANPLLFPTKPEEVKVSEETPITLEQAIELALRNNKDVQAARITLERSRAQLREALAGQYPTINSQASFSRQSSTGAEIQNETNRQRGLPETPEESTNFNGALQLQYNIYTGGRRGAQIRQTEKQIRVDELGVEIAVAQSRFLTARDYYNLQNADAQVDIEKAAVEDASQSLRDAQLLEQAGLGTRFDVLQAEVDLANANQRLAQSISDQRSGRRQLAQTIGVGQTIGLSAADTIETATTWDLSLEESIVAAYKNRAELEQQLLQREISEEQRQIELADIKPQVSFLANYNVQDNFDDQFTVADGYSFETRVNWNLFDGGRARARADRAIKQGELAEIEFADLRDRIRLEVENAYFDLTSNRENIDTAQKNLERATERLRLARLRFQAGVGTQTEVINAQRDLTQARGNYFQAIIGYNQALNQLQRALSNLPDNRLFEAP